MSRPRSSAERGFTLIELMVVVALIAIVIGLVAPSFKRMIESQRVQSINSQLVTDLQFARSEAVSRNAFVRITFGNDSPTGKTCYTIYTYDIANATPQCDCLQASPCPGSAGLVELRTVSVPPETGVRVVPVRTEFSYEPIAGAMYKIPSDFSTRPLTAYPIDTGIDAQRTLRTIVGLGGRPSVCAPSGSTLQAPAC